MASKNVLKSLAELGKGQLEVITTVRKLEVNDISFLKSVGMEERGVVSRVDYNDPNSFPLAFKGISRMFLVTGNSSQMVQQAKNLISFAEQSGVKHIVYLSLLNADLSTKSQLGAWHKESEEYLQSKTGLKYTILRCNFLMSNILLWNGDDEKKASKLKLPANKLSWLHPSDLGLAVAKILLNPEQHESNSQKKKIII